MNNWKAPQNANLPDFIIGGAMKSGTTTLHHILSSHPDIFIPKGEIHFFDIDNIIQHGDFAYFDKKQKKWVFQDLNKNPVKFWRWYSSKFAGGDGRLLGEDSTTYLASEIAARRIAMQDKSIKIIFILRDPVDRAYSQYLHMVRTGRISTSFEAIIQADPQKVLDRSMYYEQLKRYYDCLESKNIHIVIFEELIKKKEQTLMNLCGFLGIAFGKFPKKALSLHSNKSKVPKSIKLQLLFNALNKPNLATRYKQFTPNRFNASVKRKTLSCINQRINPVINKQIPKMNPETKQYLNNFFYNQFLDLPDLIGYNIFDYWFKDK